MRIDYVTIFPALFPAFLETGLIKQGREKKLLDLRVHDLRDYTTDRHKTVDDVSYGGGPGMVFKPEPLFAALDALRSDGAKVLMTSPQGRLFSQQMAEELAPAKQLIFLCGRYEGIDERVAESSVDMELSIGDFVTMGGELPAMVITEAIVRFVPGVVGKEDSLSADSFQQALLDFPHYTRPEDVRGMKVPDVLLSGHHEQIRLWRQKMRLLRTLERRPDLLQRAELSSEDQKMLREIRSELEERGKPKL